RPIVRHLFGDDAVGILRRERRGRDLVPASREPVDARDLRQHVTHHARQEERAALLVEPREHTSQVRGAGEQRRRLLPLAAVTRRAPLRNVPSVAAISVLLTRAAADRRTRWPDFLLSAC